jgi:hypothetical protein
VNEVDLLGLGQHPGPDRGLFRFRHDGGNRNVGDDVGARTILLGARRLGFLVRGVWRELGELIHFPALHGPHQRATRVVHRHELKHDAEDAENNLKEKGRHGDRVPLTHDLCHSKLPA